MGKIAEIENILIETDKRIKKAIFRSQIDFQKGIAYDEIHEILMEKE